MASECILLKGGGGGVSSDELTATNSHVLEGMKYVGKDTNDEIGTGTIPIKHAHTHDSSVEGQLGVVGSQLFARFPSAYYEVQNGVNPYVYVPFADLASILGIEANKILTTETIAGVKGTIPSKGASTYYANTSSDQTITSGQYLSGTQTIKKLTATNFSAGNIKTGVNVKVNNGSTDVLSVTGTFASDATLASNANLLTGNIAYGKNGTKYTGSMAIQGAKTASYTPSTSVQSYTIPAGYHNGSGKITINAIPSNYVKLTDKSVSFDWGTAVSMLGGVVPQYVRKIDGIYQMTGESIVYYNGYPRLKKDTVNDKYQFIVFKNPVKLSSIASVTMTIGRNQVNYNAGFRFISLDKTTEEIWGSMSSGTGGSGVTYDVEKQYDRDDEWNSDAEYAYFGVRCGNNASNVVYLKKLGFIML